MVPTSNSSLSNIRYKEYGKGNHITFIKAIITWIKAYSFAADNLAKKLSSMTNSIMPVHPNIMVDTSIALPLFKKLEYFTSYYNNIISLLYMDIKK